jgi:hypothetical protein
VPPRREIDPKLLALAHKGELTRSNTEPGTPERQAVDRVTYLRRRAARPNLTARQALAHPAPGDVLPSISLLVDDPARFIIIEGLSRRDTSRAARYDALVGLMERGEMSRREFRRRVGSWQPIAGYRFLADPDAVLAILEQRRAQDAELFVYESGRAS